MIYPLKDSFILDSGSDTYICNDLSRFLGYQASREVEVIYTGGFQMEILGYSRIYLRIKNSLFQLLRAAYIPAFYMNVISLDALLAKGYNWNPASGAVYKGRDTLFYIIRLYR